jgi:hypothetical protein
VEHETEASFPLRCTENSAQILDLCIQYTNDEAGCYMSLYVKTVFINTTGMPLEIFRMEGERPMYIPT